MRRKIKEGTNSNDGVELMLVGRSRMDSTSRVLWGIILMNRCKVNDYIPRGSRDIF